MTQGCCCCMPCVQVVLLATCCLAQQPANDVKLHPAAGANGPGFPSRLDLSASKPTAGSLDQAVSIEQCVDMVYPQTLPSYRAALIKRLQPMTPLDSITREKRSPSQGSAAPGSLSNSELANTESHQKHKHHSSHEPAGHHGGGEAPQAQRRLWLPQQ